MRKLNCLAAMGLFLALTGPSFPQAGGPKSASPAGVRKGSIEHAGGAPRRAPQDQVLVENDSFAFDKSVFEMWGLRPWGTSSACFSPANLWPALGLAEAGLDSDSADNLYRFFDLDKLELRKALGRQRQEIQLGRQEGLVLSQSTLWLDRPRISGARLRPAFRIRARALGGDIQTTDFRNPLAAARQIDGAQAYRSGRSLSGRLPDVNNSGAVVASSAVLTARWARPFSFRATSPGTFHGDHGANQIAMMHQTAIFPCLLAELGESNDFSLLELAYDRLDWAFDVVLPAEGHSLDEVEGELNGENLRDSLDSMERRVLAVSLPRFHMHTGADLRAPLSQLGLAELFTPAARFSGVYSEGGPRRIGSVLQETDIVCIEQGSVRPEKHLKSHPSPRSKAKPSMSKGRAPRGVAIKTERLVGRPVPSLLDPPVPFQVNRPFLFVVRQRSSGLIMIMGRFCGPLGG